MPVFEFSKHFINLRVLNCLNFEDHNLLSFVIFLKIGISKIKFLSFLSNSWKNDYIFQFSNSKYDIPTRRNIPLPSLYPSKWTSNLYLYLMSMLHNRYIIPPLEKKQKKKEQPANVISSTYFFFATIKKCNLKYAVCSTIRTHLQNLI